MKEIDIGEIFKQLKQYMDNKKIYKIVGEEIIVIKEKRKRITIE